MVRRSQRAAEPAARRPVSTCDMIDVRCISCPNIVTTLPLKGAGRGRLPINDKGSATTRTTFDAKRQKTNFSTHASSTILAGRQGVARTVSSTSVGVRGVEV